MKSPILHLDRDEGVLFRNVRCVDESDHVFAFEIGRERVLIPKNSIHPESDRPVVGEMRPVLVQTWYAEWRKLC